MRYCGNTLGLRTHEIAEAAQMYREGRSARQIAEHFRCHKDTVLAALVYAGVQIRTANEGRRMYWAMKLA